MKEPNKLKANVKIGDLIEALYSQVEELELPEATKSMMVTMMLGDVLKRDGRNIYFQFPPSMELMRMVA